VEEAAFHIQEDLHILVHTFQVVAVVHPNHPLAFLRSHHQRQPSAVVACYKALLLQDSHPCPSLLDAA
jgi:hypothetical protein